ncbi:hypothetical protein C0995_013628 [Termitomyces sp. Mi166|nr:hypothetical protein C0995_013628 [Termitomyces sp. Mi166\
MHMSLPCFSALATFLIVDFLASLRVVVIGAGRSKGKARATEDDDDDEEAAQKLRKELEDFVVLTTFDDKLLASLLLPPSEYFKGDSRLPQGAKILGGQKVQSLLPTTWLITAGTRLASILAGAVITS